MLQRRMTRDYPSLPMVGVAGIVWRGDQVLLIRRANDPGAGRWSLPSGRRRDR